MKRFLLPVVLFLWVSVALNAQQSISSFSITINDCEKDELSQSVNNKDIQADFKVDKAFGPAPLSVQFIDRSQGDVVSWRWAFGDGTSATTANPTHTYSQEGIYTIKLTVWDADSVYSIDSRMDFIRVVGYGLCDSVNYDIPGSYYLYRLDAPNSGFLSGNNSRGDLAKASFFNINEDKGLLMGGLFFFALKSNGLGGDPQINFNAWDNDGLANAPGTILDSYSLALSEIPIDDLGIGIYPATVAFFDSWVPISSDFYMGFELPQSAGDSLAVFTNKISAVSNGNGWEQAASGEWRSYEEGNPGYDVDNAIFPIICQPTGIDNHILEQNILVYPIPAKDKIYLTFFDQGISELGVSIMDLAGRIVVNAGSKITSTSSIDVSNLSEGLYILQLHTPDGIVNRKIIIE